MTTDIRIVTGDWATLQQDAMQIREAVFVREQHVPMELERDEMDPYCVHAVAYDADGQPIATGRLLPDAHIGRMAVSVEWRGKGIGAQVLRTLMAIAKTRGDRDAILSAQLHASAFYQREGFTAEGGTYMDAGIEHVTMRRPL